MPPQHIKGIAWVDLETTGFDPSRNEIIEIAVIRTEFAPGLPEVARYTGKCFPVHPERAHPKAFEVNGYTPEKWTASGARSPRDTLEDAKPLLAHCVLAGHNVPFDKDFLEAAFIAQGWWDQLWDYHLMDTASMAMPLWISGEVHGVSLVKLTEHFGIPHANPHEAMCDIEATVELARRLMDA